MEILRGFNLIVDDNESLHLEIEEMKLPTLEEKSHDFTPGGGTAEIDVPMGVTNKLELPFKVISHNATLKSLFGQQPGKRNAFTARQLVVDELDENGKEIEVTLDIKGRVMSREGEQMKGGEKSGYDYKISSIRWYREVHDGKVVNEMDFSLGGWTVRNGVVVNQTRNRILGVS